MATEVRDSFRGPGDVAVELLRELLATPLLEKLEFTVRMNADEFAEAEYTVRRVIDPQWIIALQEVQDGEKV